MIVVRFKQKVSPWNVGETAGFEDAKAADLIARGAAEAVTAVTVEPVETVEAVIDAAPVDRMIRRGGKSRF
jgi:hypothetical protein